MKKLIVVLLALLFTVLPVFAQTDELKALSDSQLQALYEKIGTEMSRRGLTGNNSSVKNETKVQVTSALDLTLQEGKYIIGKDIPAGNYVVTCLTTEGEDLNSAYSSLGNMMTSLTGDQSLGSLYGSLGNMMEDLSELTLKILGDYGDVLRTVTLKKDASANITLQEGTALEVSDGTCSIKSR